MSKNIKIKLNEQSIENAIKTLEKYEQTLLNKTQRFLRALADVGIQASILASEPSEYSGYIAFTKSKVTVAGKQVTIQMIGKNRSLVHKVWDGGEADVNPLLMTEFGSGFLARSDNETKIAGAGQGTFPGQTHAFDSGGWRWKTEDGEWHHSKGEKAYAPMKHAYLEMATQISQIASQIWGGN